MRRYFLFILILLNPEWLQAQDIQFSQFYAAPIYLNPAFAGSAEVTRVGVNFRNQWPSLDQTFIGYSAYVDHYIDHKNSGLGLIVNGAYETLNQLSNNEVSLVYSYKLQFGASSHFLFGAQGGFATRSAAFDEAVLSNQLDIDRGVVLPGTGAALPDDRQRSFFDVSSGALFYNDKIWLGFSAHHLFQPDVSYLADFSDPLAIRYSAHGGVRFNLPSGMINDFFNNTRQERSIGFAFNYRKQGLFDQLDLGSELFLEPLVLGLWYRGLPTLNGLPNNDAIIGMVGFSLENGIDIGYSYDFTLSNLGWRNSGGAHEISFKYTFVNQLWAPNSRKRLPVFKY